MNKEEEFNSIYQNCLNPKQRQVLKLVLKNQTNQEIAQKIGINDPSGISYHIKKISQTFRIEDDYRDRLIELFIKYKPRLVDSELSKIYGFPSSYQVGGTLALNCASYVEREADLQIFEYLNKGHYCLVLNPRQTGKSSLKIRTVNKLRNNEIKCVSVDITLLGGNEDQEARSKGFVAEIFSQLGWELDLNSWWQKYQYLTLMQRLDKAISLILDTIQNNIVIFIDEIDSIPNTDDFFAFIRACYNQRAAKPKYSRLSFCLLGTASPQELMQNKQRTPFNIGIEINLTGFTLEQAEKSLLPSLSTTINNPRIVLNKILDWTKGQPFLTQKLCQLVIKNANNREINVREIVRKYIINNWQQQDSPQHLLTICDRLIKNPYRNKILDLYRRILTNTNNKSGIMVGGDCAEVQLILSGLVTVRNQYLQVHNPIYQEIFNSQWLDFQSSNNNSQN